MAQKRRTALEKWGKELAHAIEASGMTAKNLAEETNFSPATISNWTYGRHKPDIRDIRRIETRLGTNGYLERSLTAWVTEEVPSEWRDKWVSAVSLANLVFSFEQFVVPGLLQTEDYARTVVGYNRHAPFDVEQRVCTRMERQQILNDENPPTCVFIIDENVLRRNVGGPTVMVEQLTHLRELAERPDIVVKIVPTGTEYHSACPFTIARVNGREIVYMDALLRGQVVEGNDDVTETLKIWEDIREAALPPNESLQVIEEAIESWKSWTGESRHAATPTARSV